MVEYALIVTFLAIMVIAVFVVLSPSLRDVVVGTTSGEKQSERKAAVSSALYN